MCVVIFGGSGAIGGASARLIAASGMPVFLTYLRREATARDVATSITAAGGTAAIGSCDLVQRDAIAQSLHAAASTLDSVQGIVFAAGPHVAQRYLGDIAPAEFEAAMTTDVRGFFNLAQLALPLLRGAAAAASSPSPRWRSTACRPRTVSVRSRNQQSK